MGNRTMAVRYARGLADVLTREEDLTRVEAELQAVEGLLQDDAELHRVLATPVLPRKRRRQLGERVLTATGVHPVARRLVVMLAESSRLGLLHEIRQQFAVLCDERRNIVPAEITTAVAITPERNDSYRQSLEKLTGRSVRLQTHVDPAILGGVITRIGSQVYDGSVRSQLDRLHQTLRGE